MENKDQTVAGMESTGRRGLFVCFAWFIFYFREIEGVFMLAAWRRWGKGEQVLRECKTRHG